MKKGKRRDQEKDEAGQQNEPVVAEAKTMAEINPAPRLARRPKAYQQLSRGMRG